MTDRSLLLGTFSTSNLGVGSPGRRADLLRLLLPTLAGLTAANCWPTRGMAEGGPYWALGSPSLPGELKVRNTLAAPRLLMRGRAETGPKLGMWACPGRNNQAGGPA